MKPLMRLMLVVASVALMPVLIFAGPAAAAKGGNKATVEQCKQSADMGFRNLGQCVSSGAKGGSSASLQIQPLPLHPCVSGGPANGCFGTVVGSGLQPGGTVFIEGNNFTDALFVDVSASGSVDEEVPISCGEGTGHVVATGLLAGGGTISSVPVNSPCK